MTELIERLIKVLDKKLLPVAQDDFLSGRLGILVVDLRDSYIVTIISKDNLHLHVERLQDLKSQLEKDPFTGREVKLYVDEIRELGDKHIRIAQIHIFVKAVA